MVQLYQQVRQNLSRIVWRRLRFERTQELLKGLSDFLQRQMNKAFGIRLLDVVAINNSRVPVVDRQSTE